LFRAGVVQKNRLWRVSSLAALAIATSAAYAGHPMLSEDTGTQGRGNAELELGYAWSRVNATSIFLFQPQLSYGTSSTFDFIIQPSWTSVAAPRSDGETSGREKGLGDTNLDFKWRFYGMAPWSLGVRAGLDVPTAHGHLGLPAHKVAPHGLLVLTADFTPVTLDANLGYSRVPDYLGARPDLLHFSAAATYAANERLFFVLDAAIDSNPDSRQSTPPAVALLGLIYTARPGLDLDVGYRGRLNGAAPIRQWLLGITYRGAP
jgi:hypothetical protein